MAILILTDATVTINSVVLSDHVDSVAVTSAYDDVDITAMGATAHAHAQGLSDDKITATFLQDFALTKVDATLAPLYYNKTTFPVVVKPTSAAVSSTNPSYTISSALLLEYTPLDGKVGDRSEMQVTFTPAAGSAIVRGTT